LADYLIENDPEFQAKIEEAYAEYLKLGGIEAGELIRTLENRPIPFGKSRTKKLTGFDAPLYRLRSGDFRAYDRVCGDEAVVPAVTRRKDSDKRLKRIEEERRR
jgi:mRNA-degrading endonuclease RelE of RelBE toxin-antitoxin system